MKKMSHRNHIIMLSKVKKLSKGTYMIHGTFVEHITLINRFKVKPYDNYINYLDRVVGVRFGKGGNHRMLFTIPKESKLLSELENYYLRRALIWSN